MGSKDFLLGKTLDDFFNYEQLSPAEQLEYNECYDKARKIISATVSGGKSVCYGWSGGKDSAVLRHIIENDLGLNLPSVLGCNRIWEYPDMLDYFAKYSPKNLTTTDRGLDWEWLRKNEKKLLFPTTSANEGKWFVLIQRYAQRHFLIDNKIDVMLVGRTGADGNAPDRIDGKFLSPMYHIPHKYIMAYIKTNHLPLPKIYSYPNGFRRGTHLWVSRKADTALDAMNEIVKSGNIALLEEGASHGLTKIIKYLER